MNERQDKELIDYIKLIFVELAFIIGILLAK